jgi:hypothetical protein
MNLVIDIVQQPAGTGIPVGSVHRAMRAIARAQAKQEVAVLGIMEGLLDKGLRRKAKKARIGPARTPKSRNT